MTAPTVTPTPTLPESGGPSPERTTVTRLLDELRDGRREAFDELFPVVYAALRELAHRQRRKWQGNETLNTTALVHEAYLKLVDHPHASWQSEAHFLAAAAKAIRHILINYARDQQAKKRGGGWRRTTFDEMQPAGEPHGSTNDDHRSEHLLALDEALHRLATKSGRQSRIVECRFFGAMTVKQTAEALGLSVSSVTRGWSVAQAWLYRELHRDTGPGS